MIKINLKSALFVLVIALLVIPLSTSAVSTASCQILTRNLQSGSRDQKVVKDVTRLQNYLKSKGYLKKTSGAFGGNTVTAIKKYQQVNGLPVTGKIGSIDRAQINSLICAPTTTTDLSFSVQSDNSDIEVSVIEINLATATSTNTTIPPAINLIEDPSTTYISCEGIGSIGTSTNSTGLTRYTGNCGSSITISDSILIEGPSETYISCDGIGSVSTTSNSAGLTRYTGNCRPSTTTSTTIIPPPVNLIEDPSSTYISNEVIPGVGTTTNSSGLTRYTGNFGATMLNTSTFNSSLVNSAATSTTYVVKMAEPIIVVAPPVAEIIGIDEVTFEVIPQ